MAVQNPAGAPALDTDSSKSLPWYIGDNDLPDLDESVRKIFAQYTCLPAEKVRSHVLDVRDRAWKIFPFPCIGQMRFLDFSLANTPSYEAILARLRDNEDPTLLLDVGCCFGQDLRKLVVDGVPSSRLVGVELRSEFIDLGFELFQDRETFQGRMIAGDVFDESLEAPIRTLNGSVDFVHVASFLHLFGWDGQIEAGMRLVRFLRDRIGTVVLGRQVGSSDPEERPHKTNPSGTTFLHSPESLSKMWAEIGERTNTRWKVDAFLQSVGTHSINKESKQWMDNRIELLSFEATRIE